MNINSIPNQSNNYQQSFQSIRIPDSVARKKIIKSMNSKQIDEFITILDRQRKNPVNITFSRGKLNTIEAQISCPYWLSDFKPDYKQLPIVESKFSFIKKVVKKANEYQGQLIRNKVIPNPSQKA